MPSINEQSAISAILREIPSPTILEIGACGGEETPWLRAACQDPQHLHHVLVEPDPRNVQKILDAEPTSRTRRLIVGAVSDRSGMQPFHFATNLKDRSNASGSLRKPTGHVELIPEVQFTHVGAVQCYTLDEIFEREWLTKIDLLYTDLQGAEDLMIRGGQIALSHTRYLFMEVERVELYEGQQLRDGLLAMLPGWLLVEEFPFNVLLENLKFEERGPR
jgi:FkbM family methyltransferase